MQTFSPHDGYIWLLRIAVALQSPIDRNNTVRVLRSLLSILWRSESCFPHFSAVNGVNRAHSYQQNSWESILSTLMERWAWFVEDNDQTVGSIILAGKLMTFLEELGSIGVECSVQLEHKKLRSSPSFSFVVSEEQESLSHLQPRAPEFGCSSTPKLKHYLDPPTTFFVAPNCLLMRILEPFKGYLGGPGRRKTLNPKPFTPTPCPSPCIVGSGTSQAQSQSKA